MRTTTINKMTSLRHEMLNDAKSNNKFLTNKYFENKSMNIILAFTHPLNRDKYQQKFDAIIREKKKQIENETNN